MLLGVNVVVVGLGIYRRMHPEPKYQEKYQTTAHRFLKLEAQYDPLVGEDDLKLLDEVIDEVKGKVRYDARIGDVEKKRRHLLNIFQTIDGVLIERNFIFPPKEWTATLGEALKPTRLSADELETAMKNPLNERRAAHMKAHADEDFHLIACGPSAFLYQGIAEVIGFELQQVLVPQHVFVRAKLSETEHVNWDANRGMSVSDEEYIMGWHVTEAQMRQQVYMKPLTAAEVEGEMYCSVGVHLVEHSFGRSAAEEALFRKALELEPQNLYASNNLAICLLFCADPDAQARQDALDMARRTVGFEANMAPFVSTLAYAWAANGRASDAAETMRQAVALDPSDEEMRESVDLLAAGETVYSIFKKRHPVSCWVRYEGGWMFVCALPVLGIGLLVVRRVVKGKLAGAERAYLVASPTTV
ncbi:MAG TPA: hypothetical protein VF669_17050 [Tepidisphaeraceae bacterium]